MRKADYQTLAARIAWMLDNARHTRDNSSEPIAVARADGAVKALESLAADLARELSVNRATFLAACKI